MRFLSPKHRAAVMIRLRQAGMIARRVGARTKVPVVLAGSGALAVAGTQPTKGQGGERALASRYALGTVGAHYLRRGLRASRVSLAQENRAALGVRRDISQTLAGVHRERRPLAQVTKKFPSEARIARLKELGGQWKKHRRLADAAAIDRASTKQAAHWMWKGDRALRGLTRFTVRTLKQVPGKQALVRGRYVLPGVLPIVGVAHVGYRAYQNRQDRIAGRPTLTGHEGIIVVKTSGPPNHTTVTSPPLGLPAYLREYERAARVIRRQHNYGG